MYLTEGMNEYKDRADGLTSLQSVTFKGTGFI